MKLNNPRFELLPLVKGKLDRLNDAQRRMDPVVQVWLQSTTEFTHVEKPRPTWKEYFLWSKSNLLTTYAAYAEMWKQEREQRRQERMKKVKPKRSFCEAAIEEHFCEAVKAAGGWPIKFMSPGTNGLPDRVVFHNGKTYLVELKTAIGIVEDHQLAVHRKFGKHGFDVYVIRSKEQATEFVQTKLLAS